MEAANSVIDQEAKWLASKNDKDRREARRAELKANIRELEAEHQKIKAVAPEAQALVDQWTGHVNELRRQFVHGLMARAAEGKTPVIAFDSPGALAYLDADRWIAAFPVLAEEVSGTKGLNSASRAMQIQVLDDELAELRHEYSTLGGI